MLFFKKLKKFFRLKNREKLLKILFYFKKIFLNKLLFNFPLPKHINGYWFLCYQNEIGDAIFANLYERKETSILRYFIRENMTIIDIGANEGYYSLFFAKLVGEKGKVVSFEPSEREFNRLMKNIRINKLPNIFPINKALSNNSFIGQLYVARNKTGHNSLAPLKEDDYTIEKVDVITLDKFCEEENINNIDFIKIDAEGAELEILQGSLLILKKHRPIFMIELSDKRTSYFNYKTLDIVDVFKKYNYELFSVSDDYLEELKPQNYYDENVICIPIEKKSQFFYLFKKNIPQFITFATTPKKFEEEFDVVQYNAIKSWLLLEPKPEIIIIAEDNSIKNKIYENFRDSIKHIKFIDNIKKNKYGTPIIGDIFGRVQEKSTFDIICYLNADIILTQQFMENIVLCLKEIIKKFKNKINNFLIIGKRTDLLIEKKLEFNADWGKEMLIRARKSGKTLLSGIDYFIFPINLFKKIPPFNLGRGEWDNWLVFDAIKKNTLVIDITKSTIVIHQSHSYKHHPLGNEVAGYGPEEKENQEYAKNVPHRYQIFDAPYIFKNKTIRMNFIGKFKIKSSFYRFLDITRPYRKKIFLTKSSLRLKSK